MKVTVQPWEPGQDITDRWPYCDGGKVAIYRFYPGHGYVGGWWECPECDGKGCKPNVRSKNIAKENSN